jgi:hypothetical protein
MAAFMAAALFVVSTSAFGGLCESTLTGSLAKAYEALSRFNITLIRMLVGPLFGLKDTSRNGALSVNEDEFDDEQEWSGQLNYLEKKIAGIVENASNDIVHKIDALEEVRFAPLLRNENSETNLPTCCSSLPLFSYFIFSACTSPMTEKQEQ